MGRVRLSYGDRDRLGVWLRYNYYKIYFGSEILEQDVMVTLLKKLESGALDI